MFKIGDYVLYKYLNIEDILVITKIKYGVVTGYSALDGPPFNCIYLGDLNKYGRIMSEIDKVLYA